MEKMNSVLPRIHTFDYPSLPGRSETPGRSFNLQFYEGAKCSSDQQGGSRALKPTHTVTQRPGGTPGCSSVFPWGAWVPSAAPSFPKLRAPDALHKLRDQHCPGRLGHRSQGRVRLRQELPEAKMACKKGARKSPSTNKPSEESREKAGN